MELATPFESLRTATERVGSQSALARVCGVSQAAVWKWLHKEKSLPAEHVLRVERESGVSRHALRPDIYPLETAIDHMAGVRADGEEVDFDRAAEMKRVSA